MTVANIVVAKKWGKGYRRVNLVMTLNEKYSNHGVAYYELVNAEHLFSMSVTTNSTNTVAQVITGHKLAEELEKRFGAGWFVLSYEVEATETKKEVTETEKEDNKKVEGFSIVLGKKWGKGVRKYNCEARVSVSNFAGIDDVWISFYNVDNNTHVVTVCVEKTNISFVEVWENNIDVIKSKLQSFKFNIIECSIEATETEKEVIETAVAKLDSVVRTQHTEQVDRFYIRNYKNGVIRLYWFDKSALACGLKVIVNRNGADTVVRNERFRSFITWEQHRENYTKYCKSVALKGGE